MRGVESSVASPFPFSGDWTPPPSLSSSPASSEGSPLCSSWPPRDPYDAFLGSRHSDDLLDAAIQMDLDMVQASRPEYHEMKPPARSPGANQEVPMWLGSPLPMPPMPPMPPTPPATVDDGLPLGLERANISGDGGQEHGADDRDETPAAPPRRVHRGGRRKSPNKPPVTKRRCSGDQQLPKGRLWQFLVRLLHSPARNPAIIRWEDEQEGVFCFVDGQAVARLWGEQKHNENMTYEKMSRTMRTYKNKAFGPHPRRLYYKFGERAKWRDLAMNITSARACSARG